VNLSLRSPCFNDAFSFLVKIRTSGLGATFLKCRIIRISALLNIYTVYYSSADTVYSKLHLALLVCNGSSLVLWCSISQAATNSYVYLRIHHCPVRYMQY
jgi:hypothetical protein